MANVHGFEIRLIIGGESVMSEAKSAIKTAEMVAESFDEAALDFKIQPNYKSGEISQRSIGLITGDPITSAIVIIVGSALTTAVAANVIAAIRRAIERDHDTSISFEVTKDGIKLTAESNSKK